MSVLFIFNHQPYDGSDIAWNGLRLAGKMQDAGEKVHIFLMNDAVDLARNECRPPADYFDLVAMLKDLIAKGVLVKVCGTCKARCGVYKGQPYYKGAQDATMDDLASWVMETQKVISF